MGRIRNALAERIEKHLGKNADDELYAKAMAHICEGYSPDCSYHHTCLHNGDCFDTSKPHINAAREIEKVAATKSGKVASYMLAAARELRSGGIYLGAHIYEM